ncbi:hypothetical protein RHSIM_Rhsim05G0231400 [Rhododendron simsii]|uniref:WRKY domain-containing protein n=1 Tax=Rhododendron simsii TaxID=118357 RepID=A0A834LNG2_RHOSS|nr:hypothetical protein RHSIM_Rhsim05G0231400 [Rhododendron simsii]
MDSSSPSEKLIQLLVQGHESANQLRLTLGKPSSADNKSSVAALDLVNNVLRSFEESMSIVSRRPTEGVFDKVPVNTGGNSPSSNGRKADDSEESSKSTSAFKERRGCYKRRKPTTQTSTRITPNLIDDGHAWRKYGQKLILNAKHPRNYYRCTHKFDQGCLATKQVQITEEDPPMYRTTYHGGHTCQNLLKPPQIILDSTIPGDSSNSVFISFGSTNQPNTKLNHETYYPTFPLVKQEYSTQELKPSFNHNQSSSTDHLFLLSDLTAFNSPGPMPVLSSESDHGDVISSSGVYSCTTSTTHDDSHSFDLDMLVDVGDLDVSQFDQYPFDN